MEITSNDLMYLRKAVSTNTAILFLGAGFSTDAKNRANTSLPVGSTFARTLWEALGYKGPYDDTPLQTLFDAALRKVKLPQLRTVLETNFLCTEVPQWYSVLAQLFWYRIYTTNVDDLIEKVFDSSGSAQKLDVINALKQDFKERDQFLRKLQYIKLNGTLPGEPKDLTFSVQQYASRMNQKEPWYDHFVRDYATHPVIFIGSQLNEPLLYQAIEARSSRFPGHPEQRPRSFLICRSISEAQIDALKDFKVTPLIGEAREFFNKLTEEIKPFPSRETVLLNTNPSLEGMFELMKQHLSQSGQRDLQAFYKCFSPVKFPQIIPQVRKLFLQGAEPTWADIYNELDAPREFTARIVESITKVHTSPSCSLITICGSAGCGKSTVMKRAALKLSQEGFSVFFTDSEELPNRHNFIGAIGILPPRPILFFDNVSLAIGKLAEYLNSSRRENMQATFVISCRTSKLVERLSDLKELVDVTERHMPDLSDNDIDSIITLLDRHTQLGKLKNKPLHEQRHIFRNYAHYQLLVAMLWATLGKGFNEIIAGEFVETQPPSAQMIYLCSCLAKAEEFSLSKQQLIACSTVPPAEALAYLEYNLQDIVISTGQHNDRFQPRHKSIADEVVEHVAPRPMLRDAYIALLKVLSHDLNFPADTESRTFRLYRKLINHASIYRRFSSHIDYARTIYETLSPFLKQDYHYLLQYGSLELEFGELSVAANYIEQAYSLSPEDGLVINTRGYLRYKQACHVNMKEVADQLRAEAREILLHQIRLRPRDTYAKHMLCSQELRWIMHWLPYPSERRALISELYSFTEKISKEHPASERITDLFKKIKDAYLETAIPSSS